MMQVKIKRAYETPEADDGFRILVDRLWPRGIRKADLPYDLWAKDLAPSTELRRFFHEDIMGHWQQFKEAYAAELLSSEALKEITDKIKAEKISTVTLVYASRYAENNHAIVLREALLKSMES